MKKIIFLLIAFLPILSLAQWQADMTNSMQGNIQEYKVHSDGNMYRYDYSPGDMTGVVIVKPEENITAILMVEEKMVHYTPSDGMMSRMNDPVQAYQAYLQYGTEKTRGTEKINGFECIKKVIYQDEKPIATQWYSEKLNFPVKMEVHYDEGTYMTLENIKYWKPNPSIFKVPEDYVEVDKKMRPIIPEPEPPTEWEETEASVPVEMDISRGMMVKVTIDETVYHKLIVENTGETPLKFIYRSFVDGEELPGDIQGPEKFRTRRMYMDEDYKMTLDWKAGQEVRIRVYEGNGVLKIVKE